MMCKTVLVIGCGVICCANHKEGERRVQQLWDIIVDENRKALMRHPDGLLLHMEIHPRKYVIHH
jgi:hypothetical protein